MKKIRVGIIFGGKSVEHEVSIMSAKNVINAFRGNNKYIVTQIFIDKSGVWNLNGKKLNFGDFSILKNIDVIFPIVHGTNGEDGRLQGMLEMLNIPFVGPGTLGSAICMDKEVTKRLLQNAGIKNAKYLVLRKGDKPNFEYTKKILGTPVFVKPANQGSSVGVSKAKDKKGFLKAVKDAFKYDNKILIEEYIKGREIECAVLGNSNPAAAKAIGEIIPKHEFYSYEAKYIDADGALVVPGIKLDKIITKNIRETAIKAFTILECSGMARIDFFLRGKEIFLNEVNTIPGFTNISMYPKLWEKCGKPQKKLVQELVELAIKKTAGK